MSSPTPLEVKETVAGLSYVVSIFGVKDVTERKKILEEHKKLYSITDKKIPLSKIRKAIIVQNYIDTLFANFLTRHNGRISSRNTLKLLLGVFSNDILLFNKAIPIYIFEQLEGKLKNIDNQYNLKDTILMLDTHMKEFYAARDEESGEVSKENIRSSFELKTYIDIEDKDFLVNRFINTLRSSKMMKSFSEEQEKENYLDKSSEELKTEIAKIDRFLDVEIEISIDSIYNNNTNK